jgi:hypothetical protein
MTRCAPAYSSSPPALALPRVVSSVLFYFFPLRPVFAAPATLSPASAPQSPCHVPAYNSLGTGVTRHHASRIRPTKGIGLTSDFRPGFAACLCASSSSRGTPTTSEPPHTLPQTPAGGRRAQTLFAMPSFSSQALSLDRPEDDVSPSRDFESYRRIAGRSCDALSLVSVFLILRIVPGVKLRGKEREGLEGFAKAPKKDNARPSSRLSQPEKNLFRTLHIGKNGGTARSMPL